MRTMATRGKAHVGGTVRPGSSAKPPSAKIITLTCCSVGLHWEAVQRTPWAFVFQPLVLYLTVSPSICFYSFSCSSHPNVWPAAQLPWSPYGMLLRSQATPTGPSSSRAAS